MEADIDALARATSARPVGALLSRLAALQPRPAHLGSQLVLAAARCNLLEVFLVLNRLCGERRLELDFVCSGLSADSKPWVVATARDLQLELHTQALCAACKQRDWDAAGQLLQTELAKHTLNRVPQGRSYGALHQVAYWGEHGGLALLQSAAERWGVALDYCCATAGGEQPHEVAAQYKHAAISQALRDGAEQQLAAAAAAAAAAASAAAAALAAAAASEASAAAKRKRGVAAQKPVGASAAAVPANDNPAAAAASAAAAQKKPKPLKEVTAAPAAQAVPPPPAEAPTERFPHTFGQCLQCDKEGTSLFYFQPHPRKAENESAAFVRADLPSHAKLYSNSPDNIKDLYDNKGWIYVTFGVAERTNEPDKFGLRADFRQRFVGEFAANKLGYRVDETKAVLLTDLSECLFSHERSFKNLLIRADQLFKRGAKNEAQPDLKKPKVCLFTKGVMYTPFSDCAGLKTETMIVSPNVWRMLRDVTSLDHPFMKALKKFNLRMNTAKNGNVTPLLRAIKAAFAECSGP